MQATQSLRQATQSLERYPAAETSDRVAGKRYTLAEACDKVAGQRATKSLRQATESLKTAYSLIHLELLCYRIVWLLVE
jgi:hypothetical protein